MSSYHEETEYDSVPDLEQSIRYGGCQGDEDEDADAKAKAEERERKKAEVRKRLEEANRSKKAKKGFLTPERKKKLRKLLMMKAAEDLKQQQLMKEQERQRILMERIIPLPDLESMNNESDLQAFAEKLKNRFMELEGEKYDINVQVRQKDFEINELTIAVNDLRGKFVKPTLKKVSKYDNKFKSEKKTGEEKPNFSVNLKKAEKKAFDLDQVTAKTAKVDFKNLAEAPPTIPEIKPKAPEPVAVEPEPEPEPAEPEEAAVEEAAAEEEEAGAEDEEDE